MYIFHLQGRRFESEKPMFVHSKVILQPFAEVAKEIYIEPPG